MVTLDKNELVPLNEETVKSLLLNKGESINCETEMCDYTFGQLLQNKAPLVISDVDRFQERSNSFISKKTAVIRY